MKSIKAILLLILTCAPADATEIFRFTDERGTIHYVDDLAKVPHHLRRHRTFGRRPMVVPQEQATRIIVRNNQIFLPVTLEDAGNRHQALFLVDTGASQTALLAPSAAKLGLKEATGSEATWEVVGGGKVNGRKQKIGGLQVGPHHLHDFEVGVVEHKGDPPEFDGLLGMDFLGSVTYRIDLRTSTIYWRH